MAYSRVVYWDRMLGQLNIGQLPSWAALSHSGECPWELLGRFVYVTNSAGQGGGSVLGGLRHDISEGWLSAAWAVTPNYSPATFVCLSLKPISCRLSVIVNLRSTCT